MDERGAESYRVLRRLGAGGMAEAFEAVREGAGRSPRRVALKRILPALANEPELLRLFLREARVAASLSHRNIVGVVELGRDAHGHFLALELVEGMDLRALLRALPRRRLPWPIACFIAREIAAALAHAHGRACPVLHRDVSPANILLGRDGAVKLTDFGIGRVLGEPSHTATGTVRGNLAYMAPERFAATGSEGPACDVFSLGVVLYRMLSGRRPHRAANPAAAMIEIARGRTVPLGLAAPDLPPELHALVDRALSASADERPCAAAFADQLAHLADAADAGRVLGSMVDEHRSRAAASPAAPSERPERTTHGPTQPREGALTAEAPRGLPARWQRYALAPHTWAAVDLAAAARRRADREPRARGRGELSPDPEDS